MSAVGFLLALGGSEAVEYQAYAKGMLRSMVARLRGLSAPVFFVCDERLTKPMRKELDAIYPVCEFWPVPERYAVNGKAVPKWWLLEAFNPDVPAEKIITLGSDMICVGDASPLIYPDHGLIGAWHEPVRPCFNSGAMVASRAARSAEWYEKLLAYTRPPGFFGHDQAAVNAVFVNRFTRLPDCTQQFASTVDPDSGARKQGAIFLHYIAKLWSAKHLIPKWALDELNGWLDPKDRR